MTDLFNSLTDVPGIEVGHANDKEALTGCTVVLCKNGAIGGVDQRGGAPGTRETDLLRPTKLVQKIHGVLLSGGSAYGLNAAAGVMRFLEEQNIGFSTGYAIVPIVCGAVVYDLGLGSANIRPDAQMGYQACLNASAVNQKNGNVGAGTGASVGKVNGMDWATKAGLGNASIDLGGGVILGALMVVNAYGEIRSPNNGEILAGVRSQDCSARSDPFTNAINAMKLKNRNSFNSLQGTNTMIGVIATNAKLSKEEVNKLAEVAQDGIARVTFPAHTMMDGDTIFALSTGKKNIDPNILFACAGDVVVQSILSAVINSDPAGGLPSYKEIRAKADTRGTKNE